MHTPSTPELSIIVPLLNEEQTLPHFFRSLESQVGLCCEVIFCDGGSQDGSLELLRDYADQSQHQVEILSTEQGRGRQMNHGAHGARSQRLLFLHVDSSWQQQTLLRDAVNQFDVMESASGSTPIAAHFSLRFSGPHCQNRFYRYLSEKSHLNRSGTIFGDQGMLVSKQVWSAMGGFDTRGEILEDVVFADEVMRRGRWVLLPQQIFTSNRRYQQDGRFQRVLNNGLLLVISGAGFSDLFASCSHLGGSYCQSGNHCSDTVSSLATLLHRMSLTRYGCFWYGCARVIADHLWLVLYAGSWIIPSLNGQQRRALLSIYDRRVAKWLIHPVSYTILAILSWFLFYLSYLCLPLRWLVQGKGRQRQFSKEHI